uniref:Uncharacterized protein n=1 Tax=Panagrolaimus sp. ES5 TaxID=591445 RepID=A0AC34FZF5_9BILA
MFNYEPNSDELIAPVEPFVPEVTSGAGDFDKLDPAQVIKDEELRMIRDVAASDNKNRDLVVAVLEPVEGQSKVRHQWESRSLYMVSSESDVSRLEEEAHIKWEQKSFFARLLLAISNCVTAHTDVISYVIACIVHAKCTDLITLPLPMLVFFWGKLANPRPSKNFWISYTEFEIIVKFIFQFGFCNVDVNKTYKINIEIKLL